MSAPAIPEAVADLDDGMGAAADAIVMASIIADRVFSASAQSELAAHAPAMFAGGDYRFFAVPSAHFAAFMRALHNAEALVSQARTDLGKVIEGSAK